MSSNYVRKNPPRNYITLIDGAYWARFTATREGKCVNIKQKSFPFSAYNYDPVEAKEAAERWVKYWAPRLKKPKLSDTRRKLHRAKPKGKNQKRAGVSHQTYYKLLASGDYREHNCWAVTWSETHIVDGKKVRKGRHKYFSFDKNNKKQKEMLYEKAVEWREKMEALHYEGSQDTR